MSYRIIGLWVCVEWGVGNWGRGVVVEEDKLHEIMWGLWDPMNSKHNHGVCRPSVFLPIGQSPRPAQPSTSGKPPMPHKPRHNQCNKPKWLVNRFSSVPEKQQVHNTSSYTDKKGFSIPSIFLVIIREPMNWQLYIFIYNFIYWKV